MTAETTPPATAPMSAAARGRRILRTSVVGIAANVLLAAFKAAVGLAANSVAVVLDAVNNLTDALSFRLVDFSVRDRAALRDALLADLAPRFPGRAISINFDTDYSD